MFGSTGSKTTSAEPRGEQFDWPLKTCVGVLSVQFVGLPWLTSVNVWPPSLERQSPKCGAPGMFAPRSMPLQQVLLIPRDPCAPEATKTVDESPGFTAIEPMPRPLKSSAPSGPDQWSPPSFDL